MNTKPIHYLQYDPRWAGIPFTSHKDPKQTIGRSGCGVTSMAMVLATFLNDETIKPDYTAKLCVDNGFRTYDDGTAFNYFPFIAKKFGLRLVQSTNVNDAVWGLQHGGLVVCSMTPGYFTKEGHFILAWDVQDGNIIVNDPNSTVRTKASIGIFKEQCQRYFIFYKQEVQPMPEKELTLDEAKQIIKDKVGLDDNSIFYLDCYKYGNEMIIKFAKALNK